MQEGVARREDVEAPKPLQGVSGGKVPTVENSERNAKTRGGLKGSAK